MNKNVLSSLFSLHFKFEISLVDKDDLIFPNNQLSSSNTETTVWPKGFLCACKSLSMCDGEGEMEYIGDVNAYSIFHLN